MMPDILKTIVDEKWREIEARRGVLPLADLEAMVSRAGETRGFMRAIRRRVEAGKTAVIAELKKASPSKGVIREDFDPEEIARSYELGGATCLSVLTDTSFFGGSDEYLARARRVTTLPVLRKDFIVDPWQVYEARAIGADCILLIVSVLTPDQLSALNDLARELDMDVLVEVHDAGELDTALKISPDLVGINNRDLRTFEVDLATTRDLAERVPDDAIVVTESGIHTIDDVASMKARNIHAFLVGEAFMVEEQPGEKLRNLFG